MLAKVSHAKSKRTVIAALLLGALATIVVAQSSNFTLLFVESFDDDVAGAMPANLAPAAGKPAITNSSGTIVGLVTGLRSSIQVVATTGTTGNALRFADGSLGNTGLVGATIAPAKLPALGKTFAAKFSVTPMCDGVAPFSCGIIDNEVTPGSGRIARLTFLPNGKFALNDQIVAGTYEANHKYAVELTAWSTGSAWKANALVTDTGTGAVVLLIYGASADDPAAKPARLKFETADVGRGTFDVDSIELDADQ